MNLKNELIAHRKIDIYDFATVKKYASQCYVIDFGTAKNAIVEGTINKNNADKIALREIARIESTTFKFL